MLVFGGTVRFLSKPTAAAAWWAGVGAGIMALTRPYEGMWFCIVPALVMLWKWTKWKKDDGQSVNKLCVVAAAVVPLLAALAFLLTYNHAVTGEALKFPHRLYQEQNAPDVSVFTWESPGPAPANRNPELAYQMRRFNPEVVLSTTLNLSDVVRQHLEIALPHIGGFFFRGLLGIGAAWAILSGQIWRRSEGRLALASIASFFLMLARCGFLVSRIMRQRGRPPWRF